MNIESDTKPDTDPAPTEEDVATEEAAEAQRLALEVDITDAGPCRKHVRVTVPRADLDRCFADATSELLKSASVPGFRPGHAPQKLIERRFKKELGDEVKRTILLQSLEQLESEDRLDPINQPDIDIESLDIPDQGDFEYDFEVEVRPDFDLPDYAGLTIERPVREVTDQDVEHHLQEFLEQFGTFENKTEPAAEGDYLRLDIAFEYEGRPLRKIQDERVRLLPVLRFQDAEVSNFGELMTGVQTDDVREAEVIVSQEAESLELRGETVEVRFTVQAVERLLPPDLTKGDLGKGLLDELGVSSLEEIRDLVRSSLERQVTYQQRQSVREQVLDKITESADWSLPEELVRKQVENALRREILEMHQAGFTRSQIQSRENELRQNAVTTTRQALKEHFVLDKIANQENIEVTQTEMDAELQLMAIQQGENVRRLRTRLVRSGMMDNLEAQIRERKAVDIILERAKFEDVPMDPLTEDNVTAIPHAVCGKFAVSQESTLAASSDEE